MSWNGIIFGALIGLLITRSVWGAVAGAIIGYMLGPKGGVWVAAGNGAASISGEFFRTTFEIMGYVAKSDGRVSEAEIDAARRLMQELNLSPADISAAITCFRTGKSAGYDAELSIERLRESCGLRYDLLRAFVDVQLRAALAGNGISPPVRKILERIAGRLGLSALEFAHMEASLRARQRSTSGKSDNLAECYAELEVDASISDAELVKAYRRQMSRHHPDKLVANGLPESMAQMAKEKTQRIQEAYEGVRAARGMR
ncbi:MAG TPA: co-chaperone DjlA [Steroidobacteraceae bacterium]|jgi:DnaJ like chaperone protein|nr:co-chaperone DjlA [Steroidobacteraceae bacterium]